MAMLPPGMEDLQRLQSLHRDLVNLGESRLPNLQRLLSELETRVEDFRKLLEKQSKDDKSRQILLSDSLEVGDVIYEINDDFKQETIQLADFLDLNELEAAKLYLQGQAEAHGLDRSALACSVIFFHQRRQFILECLRLTFAQAILGPDNDQARPFVELIGRVLHDNATGQSATASSYCQKCLEGMGETEKRLQQINERVQSMSITGQTMSAEYVEMMAYQNESLNRQHESLGAIAFYLVKLSRSNLDDFRFLLSKSKTIDRYDATLIHYIPVLTRSISRWASDTTSQEAQSLQDIILGGREVESWPLRSFQAAAKVVWLEEFSGRLLNQPEDLDRTDIRSATFMEALRDGAFQFILSASRDTKSDDWFDPLRHGITTFLTSDFPSLQSDPLKIEGYFHELLMDQFQSFAEGFISHMPDTLRQLKYDEDEQRRQTHGVVQSNTTEYDLHLERFLIIIAYAFEGFPEPAEGFWVDTDSNLFGFLQWASQRQSTPRVAAFCEMLRALSEDEACAEAAHKFLLDEGSGRSRRNSPLSWNHVFSELEFYSSTIRDRPVLQQGNSQTELVEPESAMMLECYLRLISHLCKSSGKARTWILGHSTFHLHEHLLLLCGSFIESRLRGCALSALTALLTGRVREVRDSTWSAIDAWISGSTSTSTNQARPISFQSTSVVNERIIFESLSTGFEEPNAFVRLLQALIASTTDDTGLNDALPFPEALGAAYRMPGIDPYVDFVFELFAAKSFELQDPVQLRIMRWSCLDFVTTCLATFNDGLVIFANKSSISVDAAIKTSSLSNYARLHPFARVMEWAFNERVITALFSTAIQDMKEVNIANADTPLILGLVRSIEFIDHVMTLQSTYFDIVRPIVKMQSTNRRPTVANFALASFEEAILNNVAIITSLGLYCGSGHQDLALRSIRLLQRLSSSRKLTAPLTGPNRSLSEKSRLITALERNDEVVSISRALVSVMNLDLGEIEQGPDSAGLVIKAHLLGLLNGCLESVTDRPTIAHLLLGFACHARVIDIASGGPFADGVSLLHTILRLALDCPYGDEISVLSWLVSLKTGAMFVLARLWKSPLSSQLILPELRVQEFLFGLWLGQPSLGPDILWDGKTMQEPEFLFGDSAVAYANFLRQRSALFDYVATELRSAASAGMETLKSRIQSVMLGSLPLVEGPSMPCLTIFDLVDFSALDFTNPLPPPDSKYFGLTDFDICKIDGSILSRYDVPVARQVIILRQNELHSGGQLTNAVDEKQVRHDAESLLQWLQANNNQTDILIAHAEALATWVKLVVVVLETCKMETAQRNGFISLGLQMILPRFERSFAEDVSTACNLAELACSLIRHADFGSLSGGANIVHDVGNDRLFQLFRIGLVGIQSPEATAKLRETCYLICHEYLHNLPSSRTSALAKQALQNVKTTGDRVTEVLCDDAYAGEGACRTSALLLLGAIVATSNEQGTKDIIEYLGRLNFVQMVVDSIRNIPLELGTSLDSAQLLSYYNASLALLLRVAQTRLGAALVMNAGLFDSVRDSGLFSADPDIGIEIENPKALTHFFNLLLSIVRIINAVVLSRGTQNDQTIAQAQQFLQEYRLSIMAIFKRSAKIGVAGDVSRVSIENEGTLRELVDGFTILVEASGFLDTEQEMNKRTTLTPLFT